MSINLQQAIASAKTVKAEDAFVVKGSDAKVGYTAYDIWKLASEALRQIGSTEEYSSQRFYNFSRSGKIDGVKYPAGAKPRFDEDTVKKFLARFIRAHMTTVAAEPETSTTTKK